MRRLRYFSIKNMESEEDVEKIERILKELDGILRISADLDAQAIEVEYEDEKVNKELMAKVLMSHGYFMGI